MHYQLVLTEPVGKDVGENVFFDDLSLDYPVYVLFYPGTKLNQDNVRTIADDLRNLGKITGGNLFVNIAELNDPAYEKLAGTFNIRKYPTIIITAIEKLASPQKEYSTAYVRIDNKKLLNNPDLTLELVEKMYNLFLTRKIAEALKEKNQHVRVLRMKSIISETLKGLRDFLSKRDITVSFLNFKLQLKPKAGG